MRNVSWRRRISFSSLKAFTACQHTGRRRFAARSTRMWLACSLLPAGADQEEWERKCKDAEAEVQKERKDLRRQQLALDEREALLVMQKRELLEQQLCTRLGCTPLRTTPSVSVQPVATPIVGKQLPSLDVEDPGRRKDPARTKRTQPPQGEGQDLGKRVRSMIVKPPLPSVQTTSVVATPLGGYATNKPRSMKFPSNWPQAKRQEFTCNLALVNKERGPDRQISLARLLRMLHFYSGKSVEEVRAIPGVDVETTCLLNRIRGMPNLNADPDCTDSSLEGVDRDVLKDEPHYTYNDISELSLSSMGTPFTGDEQSDAKAHRDRKVRRLWRNTARVKKAVKKDLGKGGA